MSDAKARAKLRRMARRTLELTDPHEPVLVRVAWSPEDTSDYLVRIERASDHKPVLEFDIRDVPDKMRPLVFELMKLVEENGRRAILATDVAKQALATTEKRRIAAIKEGKRRKREAATAHDRLRDAIKKIDPDSRASALKLGKLLEEKGLGNADYLRKLIPSLRK